MVRAMGGPSEREYREKLNKILENVNNEVRDVREKFAKIEKIRVDALKKTEEMKHSADHIIDKMEIEITKSKDLAIESRERLHSEIVALKNEIKEKYTDIKKRISETMVPA